MTAGGPVEELVFFPCGEVHLAGVLAKPVRSNGIVVLIPWGAGAYPSSGRNRMRTRLARLLADQGFHSFRFDYSGVGESEGEYRYPSLSVPYVVDIVAACDWLASQGLRRLAIIANCFGGWSSLMAAHKIAGLEGIALVNSPVHHDHRQLAGARRLWRWWFANVRRATLAKLRKRRRRERYRRMIGAKVSATLRLDRIDHRYRRAIEGLVERHIPILLVYGRGGFTEDFETELDRGLRPVLKRAGARTQVMMIDQDFEGYPSLESQEVVIRAVTSWLQELARLPARSP